MRIGNRLYPYPVLNANQVNSSYKVGSFIKICYDQDEDDTYLRLENVYCEISSKYLNSLIKKGQAIINLVFECPQAFYRKNFEISLKPQNIDIPLADINGTYIISVFVTLKRDYVIPGNIDEFVDEYSDLMFRLEKHDILAVDEGHKDSVNFTIADDLKQASIFSVCEIDDYPDGKMTIENSNELINIYISKKAYDAYFGLEKMPIYNDNFYALLATPALIKCINKIIKPDDSDKEINEAIVDCRWFNAFNQAFNKKYERNFKADDLDQIEEIIQNLFDYPCGKAILLLKELNPNNTTAEGDDDYED